MSWYEVLGIVIAILAGLVTIGGGIVWVLKRFRRTREISDNDPSGGISLKIPPSPPGMTHAEIKLTIDYVDGLPDAPPKIKDHFEEARQLKKEYKYREAIKQYQACFQPETTDSQRAALHILIGNCFYHMSELEEAEGHYRQAETEAKEANDKQGLAAALGNIGNICQTKGELDKALEKFEKILTIHKDIGNRKGEAADLGNIGIIYKNKGELDKALDYHQQSLKIEKEIGNKEGQAQEVGNIGIVYRRKGELDKALDYHLDALKINQEIGRKEGEAIQLGNIGLIYQTKGEMDKALDYHQ